MRAGRFQVNTVLFPNNCRFVMFGTRSWIGWLMVSRKGTVRTALMLPESKRSKHWTRARDHRRRVARAEAILAGHRPPPINWTG